MVINLISNDNGVGLSTDMKLLKSIFNKLGHIVIQSNYNSTPKGNYDINFHLEMACGSWMNRAPKNILIPNPEWFLSQWNQLIPRFTEVWCKSRSAIKAFQSLKGKTHYTGWLSLDRSWPMAEKQRKFLHLKGRSPYKGTAEVIRAWVKNPHFPELVIVSALPIKINPLPKNITLLTSYQDDQTINRLMNECQFHLCPSEAEGFGHYIAEGMSCGAVVITTNAEPMNELIQPGIGILVEPSGKRVAQLGMRYAVAADAIAKSVESSLALSEKEIEVISQAARNKWQHHTTESINRIMERMRPQIHI